MSVLNESDPIEWSEFLDINHPGLTVMRGTRDLAEVEIIYIKEQKQDSATIVGGRLYSMMKLQDRELRPKRFPSGMLYVLKYKPWFVPIFIERNTKIKVSTIKENIRTLLNDECEKIYNTIGFNSLSDFINSNRLYNPGDFIIREDIEDEPNI